MYLRELHIENLKQIRELVLRFDPKPTGAGAEAMWTVLIGRNGRGKTSVLRAIAAAAFGNSQASALAKKWMPTIPDRRAKTPAGTIIGAEFAFGSRRPRGDLAPPTAKGFVSWLGYTAGDSEFVGPTQLSARHRDRDFPSWSFDGQTSRRLLHTNDPRSVIGDPSAVLARLDDFIVDARRKNLDHLFVAAYGNTRRLARPGSIESRSGQSYRVASLFDPDVPLTGLDFFKNLGNGRAERFQQFLDTLVDQTDLLHEIRRVVLRKLLFDDSDTPDEIQQDQTYTATLKLPGGPIEVPTAWLADGQQALLSWLADLIGHLMLDQKDLTDPADFEGLVLVDDIDLHIHPDWQTRLVPALKRAFPRLQFIVTTHSPLIIASLRPEEVTVLDLDHRGDITAKPLDVDPRLLTSTELYRHVFGVEDTPPDPIHRTLRRYEYLARDPIRTDDEQARMLRLRAELEAADVHPLMDPEPREQDPEDP